MASAPPSSEMEQEFNCPICLECLTDPVVLDCGHSFCQGCITNYCEKWEDLEEVLECPVCRLQIQKGDFRRNYQLANIMEKIKLMNLSPGKEDLCLRHNEKLHLFCKEDEKLVCDVCKRSPEHQGHTVLLLEEAAQQHKDKILSCLETLRTERKKIQKCLVDVKDESLKMLKSMESEKQKTVDEFKTLYQLLYEQETDLLAQIEETEKEIARKRDKHLARLSEELSSLESQIQEMEEKLQQLPSELLQDVRVPLQRYEKEKFEDTEAFLFKLKRWVFECCYNPFVETATKQFRDILPWACPKLREDVTLDPASASSRLVQTRHQKQLWWQRTPRERSEDPEKSYGFVLGSEGFTAGCHFWEVKVGFGDCWAVGVARKPVKDKVTFTPEEGIWAVGRWNGRYKAFIRGTDPTLTLRGEPYCLRVCLNYEGGQVAFFDTYRAALLYEFSGASFCDKTLHPFFAVYGDGDLCLYV